jgi:N-acylneuraminate cytidylyltransferase/CMP-N,N'-diacetyllegionaminic acid synthase
MLAIIPARGGSKRLPGKNIRPLSGKPLIHHTLEAALAAKKISRVIFNTDSEEIRDIALQVPGVEAPFLRPPELATDTANASDLHLHTIDWLKENEGMDVESFCVLLPTNPLRLATDIDNAISLFEQRQADIVTSVTRSKPLAWYLNIDSQTKKMKPLIEAGTSAMNNYQELPDPPVFLNGSIYVIRSEPYRKTRSYFGPNTYGYEMPVSRTADIDELADFEVAEALMTVQRE